MTFDDVPGARLAGAIDTARLVLGIEWAHQRRTARRLLAPLRAQHARTHAVTSYALSTELTWQGPSRSTGCAVLYRVDGATVVDLRLVGTDWREAARIARAAGTDPAHTVHTDDDGQRVLDLGNRTIAQALAALQALGAATCTPGPLERARHRYAQAVAGLAQALEDEVAQLVADQYPAAAWLVVDPGGWLDDPADGIVQLLAVLDADQSVLRDHTVPAHTDDWAHLLQSHLTEIAEYDGTGSWPELCGTYTWLCPLRSVPLTADAVRTVPVFTHTATEGCATSNQP